MNNLPPGFIMGFWVKAKDKNPQSMHFTAPKKLFGVLRDGLRGLPLNGSGPLAATQERAVTHGATEWKLDFSLSDAPGLEGLLYLFDSEDGAATYQRSCGKPWIRRPCSRCSTRSSSPMLLRLRPHPRRRPRWAGAAAKWRERRRWQSPRPPPPWSGTEQPFEWPLRGARRSGYRRVFNERRRSSRRRDS